MTVGMKIGEAVSADVMSRMVAHGPKQLHQPVVHSTVRGYDSSAAHVNIYLVVFVCSKHELTGN